MGKANLKDKVYDGIYQGIMDGDYQQNVILTERELVEHYKVSKSPVREALIELSKDGILNSIPRVGYRIKPVTVKEIVDTLELRLCIEIDGLRKAYDSIKQEDLDYLRTMIDDHSNRKDTVISKNWSRNSDFHAYLYSLNGNNYGYKILNQIIRQSSLYIAQYFQIAWDRESESNGAYHIAVVEALENKDIEKAIEMLTNDILAVKKEIQNLHTFI